MEEKTTLTESDHALRLIDMFLINGYTLEEPKLLEHIKKSKFFWRKTKLVLINQKSRHQIYLRCKYSQPKSFGIYIDDGVQTQPLNINYKEYIYSDISKFKDLLQIIEKKIEMHDFCEITEEYYVKDVIRKLQFLGWLVMNPLLIDSLGKSRNFWKENFITICEPHTGIAMHIKCKKNSKIKEFRIFFGSYEPTSKATSFLFKIFADMSAESIAHRIKNKMLLRRAMLASKMQATNSALSIID